jgi:hypothetical protein
MNRILARTTMLLAAGALCTGLVAASCSSNKGPDTGSVKLDLTTGGLTISQVSYTVNQGGAVVTTGAINVSDPNATVSLDLVLPVGTGYTISFTATAQPGSVACMGTSAAFNISANQSTPVPPLTLTCGVAGTGPSQTGSASISVNVSVINGDNCPAIKEVSASPGQISVGGSIALSANATDSDATDALTYTWSSGGTTFATGKLATFVCSPAGTQTISLVVDDHHTPSNCTAPATVTVTCIATATGGSGGSAAGSGGSAAGSGGSAAGSGGSAAGSGGSAAGSGGSAAGSGGSAPGGSGGTAQGEGPCGACELASSDGNCDPGFLSQDGSGVPFGCDSLPTVGQVSACKALLTCINTNNCSTNSTGTAAGDNASEGCYCGPAPETSSACIGGAGVVGKCIALYHAAAMADSAALTATSTEGAFASFIATAAFDPTTAVGMADNIKDCAFHALCTVCNGL